MKQVKTSHLLGKLEWSERNLAEPFKFHYIFMLVLNVTSVIIDELMYRLLYKWTEHGGGLKRWQHHNN